MGNIIDYARTETRDFGELPFREADALVLAQLSYETCRNACRGLTTSNRDTARCMTV